MFFRLLLLFTTVPLIELALLVVIDRHIGLPATLALVLGTAMVGAWLAKSQGLRVLARLQHEIQDGRMPTEPLLDGLMIFVAGAVLLTPGLLTDLFGFFLLAPAGRGLVRRVVAERLKQHFVPGASGGPRVVIIEPGDGEAGNEPSPPSPRPRSLHTHPGEGRHHPPESSDP